MFSVVFSSANQQLIIFNHTSIAAHLFQRGDRDGAGVPGGICRRWGGRSKARLSGERNLVPRWRERSPVTRPAGTVTGTRQTSRSS